MGLPRNIWKYETRQADKIARSIVEPKPPRLGWRIFVLPVILIEYRRFRKSLKPTRKNLLFTRQLALEAAQGILQGGDHAMEFRKVEIKTRNILDCEKKGLYTEKVRRKQLYEIELLITHYLNLLKSNQARYEEMVKAVYPSKQYYRVFLEQLQKAEREVIQASIFTVRRGSKKERLKWFEKMERALVKARTQEVKRIFTYNPNPAKPEMD